MAASIEASVMSCREKEEKGSVSQRTDEQAKEQGSQEVEEREYGKNSHRPPKDPGHRC